MRYYLDMSVLFYILVSTFLISLIAFVGALTLFFKKKLLDKVLLILVAFSAGALIGGAFLHLLPETIVEVGLDESSLLKAFLYLLLGFCIFFILEQFIRWHHHHDTHHPKIYRTTGWNSVQDILGSLMLIKRVAGRLSGIPLMLKLFPKTTQLPQGVVTVYTVSLIFAGSALALAEAAEQCPMIGHDESMAPDQTIEAEEETEIAEEFYPPESDTERAEAAAEATTEKVRTKPAEKKKEEPTAAELARADANKLKKKEAQAKAAAKKDQARTKKEQQKAEVAAATNAMAEEKDTSGNMQGEEPPIDEGEVLDEPASDFGWV